MNELRLYGILIFIMAMLSSCDQNIDAFNNEVNYISFDIPYKVDQYGRKTTELIDSMEYSFAMEDISVTEYVFRIPVNVAGLPTDVERSYRVVVNTDGTTAVEEDWDNTSLASAVVPAGALRDTLEVVVKRTAKLKDRWLSITLQLQDNENFEVGAEELKEIKIAFTDILQPPTWWTTWERYFGSFVREKYIKWQEIYYLGADPNVERWGPNTGKQLYWDNMPYYVNSSWYPSTFMFIGKLKQYFIDNEVYPDGDTSKPRITLP